MKRLLLAIFASAALSVAQGAPIVTGGSGTVGHGNAFTIVGSGFGVKVSPIDGSPKPALLFDFEDGTYNSNATYSATSGTMSTHEQAIGTITGRNNSAKGSVSNTGWIFTTNDHTDISYILPHQGRSGKVFKMQHRQSTIPNDSYTVVISGQTRYFNEKFDRFWNASTTYPNRYLAQNGDRLSDCTGGGGHRSFVETAGDGSFPGSLRFPTNSWMSEMFEMKFNSATNLRDGYDRLWQDGVQTYNDSSWGQDYTTTPAADLVEWFSQDDSSNMTTCNGSKFNWDVRFDDVIYDWGTNAHSRVVMINSNSLTTATKVEYQVATVWADGSITFFQRHGAITSGENKYIVVFNDGVASTPFLIQTSSGSGNPAPTITNITPSISITAGGRSIVMNGTGYLPGVVVKVGTTTATSTTLNSSSKITFVTPSLPVGTYSVSATNTDTQVATLASTMTVTAPPVISTFTPVTGYALGGNSIMLGGSNLSLVTSCSVGGTAGTAVTVITSTAVRFTTPAKAEGSYTISCTASDSQSGTSTGTITLYAAPTVTSVLPTNVPLAGASGVQVFGTGFRTGMTMTVGGTACTSVSVLSSTAATCTVPAKTAATYTLSAINTDTQAGSLASAITYTSAPGVIGASPNFGTTAGGTSVTITGIAFSASINSVKFGGTNATSVVRVNSTTITCVTPAHAAGFVSIVVENNDTQTGTALTAFEFQTPAPAFTNPDNSGSVCPCQ